MKQINAVETSLEDVIQSMKAQQQPFAIATVVRTVGSTSANPGAKAVLDAEGAVLHGWLGGGCVRGAVARAVQGAVIRRTPELVSIAPRDALEEEGLQAGDVVDGTHYASNGCPSRGTIDVFIEPILPPPLLIVLGQSPVAKSLRALAPSLDWTPCDALPESLLTEGSHAIIIATQGQGDLDTLSVALSLGSPSISFVGSARKFAALSEKLSAKGFSDAAIQSINAPAGLDINAETPAEIAVSILAELIQQRRTQKVSAADA